MYGHLNTSDLRMVYSCFCQQQLFNRHGQFYSWFVHWPNSLYIWKSNVGRYTKDSETNSYAVVSLVFASHHHFFFIKFYWKKNVFVKVVLSWRFLNAHPVWQMLSKYHLLQSFFSIERKLEKKSWAHLCCIATSIFHHDVTCIK